MYTVSGIDPTAVKALIDEINQLKQRMRRPLDEIVGPIQANIRANYQGTAADTVLARIRQEIPKLDMTLDNLIRTLITNINDDLSDTQNTDNALAG